ncbi:MAG: hypothetical protein AB1716_05355 [Planctomycetota bacterium]
MQSAGKYAASALSMLLAVTVGGCPGLPGGAPAVSLEGTWQASGPGGVTLPVNVVLTVNASNRITNLRLDPPGQNIAPPMAIVINVTGSAAEFNGTFPLGLGSISFTGTLNEAATVLNGTLTVRLNVPGAPPEASSAAVFTKL